MSDHIQKPDDIMYKEVHMNNGRYKFRAIPLNNIQASAITITATGSTLLEWKIPAKTCFNSARTVLSYTLTFPAQGAGIASWYFDDTFEIAQSVQMGTASVPGYLVDLQFANNYVAACRKIDTKATDFENLDYTMALHKSDSTVVGSLAPAVTSNFFPPSAVVPAVNPYGLTTGTFLQALTLAEPGYARSSALNAAVSVIRNVPFSALTHTCLGMDKNQYFAEDIYIRVMLAPSSKMGYTSTSVTDPTAGAAAFLTQPTISGLQLNLCVQVDPVILASVQDKFERGAMKYTIPYLYAWRNTTAAAGPVSVTLPLNSAYGRLFKRIVHVPFALGEATNHAYDHCNFSPLTASCKLSSYQTALNSVPLQDQYVTTADMADCRTNRDFLRDSAIRNSAAYEYNWFHIDSFSSPKSSVMYPWENIVEGLPLANPVTWTLTGTTAAAGLTHYTFAEFVREVQALSSGLVVVTI